MIESAFKIEIFRNTKMRKWNIAHKSNGSRMADTGWSQLSQNLMGG